MSIIRIALVSLVFVEVQGKPIDDVVVGPEALNPAPSMSEDHFGLPDEVYERMKSKARQLRLLLAEYHNYPIPTEEHLSSLLFGDLLFTEQQLEWLIGQIPRGSRRRRKRKIIDFETFPVEQWPLRRAIPFTFSGEHDESEKNYIRTAISIWEVSTCVRFKEIDLSEVNFYKDYVYIQRKTGCYSNYGRIGGRQLVGLNRACLTNPLTEGYGFVIHEFGHVLGLYHEQSRSDRDLYVRIVQENIQVGDEHNFDKYRGSSVTTYDLPYDFASIMHYSSRSFSVDRGSLDTIQTVDPLYQMTIGQRFEVSFLDHQAINTAYCPGCDPLPCQRGGYPDPNDCFTCKCPDGFTGRYCDEVQHSNPEVCPSAGQIFAGIQYECLHVGRYDNDTSCTWLIKTSPGCEVELWFKGEFEVLTGNAIGPTCYHYVEIRYRGTPTTPGPRFCGNKRPGFRSLVSEGGEMLVLFRTPQILKDKQPLGFTFCFRRVGNCAGAAIDVIATPPWSTAAPQLTPTDTPAWTSTNSGITNPRITSAWIKPTIAAFKDTSYWRSTDSKLYSPTVSYPYSQAGGQRTHEYQVTSDKRTSKFQENIYMINVPKNGGNNNQSIPGWTTLFTDVTPQAARSTSHWG